MSKKELEEYSAWVDNEIEEAIKFAEDSPLPEANELYKDIYMEEDYPYIKEY